MVQEGEYSGEMGKVIIMGARGATDPDRVDIQFSSWISGGLCMVEKQDLQAVDETVRHPADAA